MIPISWGCDLCGARHAATVGERAPATTDAERLAELEAAVRADHARLSPACTASTFYRVMADLRLRA